MLQSADNNNSFKDIYIVWLTLSQYLAFVYLAQYNGLL